MISDYMTRQKPRQFSYTDFSEFEESIEYLLSRELNTDEIFGILKTLSDVKYISEVINPFFELDSPRNSVIQFLYLNYCLDQFIQIESILNTFKKTMIYYSFVAMLLKETANLIEKIKMQIKSEKFNF